MRNRLMQFFAYEHFSERLQAVGRPFSELAEVIDEALPDDEEKTTVLRKLLEAKDCAVREFLLKA